MVWAKEQSDDDLLQRAVAGDESAFVLIYRRWQGRVYRFALHMSGSPSLAEDVTQEAFMALLRGSNRFDPTLGTVPGYLLGIARNHVRRRLDSDRVLVPLPEPETSDRHAGNKGTHGPMVIPPVDYVRRDRIDGVRKAVLSLPERYREVVVLCDLQEMSYEEAAAIVGCAVGTVRSRLHRARTFLAAKLSELRTPHSPFVAGRCEKS
jgi:RNA polymerase sigma-70 factor (ECF subfamily)